jgi:hypothetical protein
MSRAITFLLVAAFLLVSYAPLAAQGKGHGAATAAAHKPKTTGQPTTARAPKSTPAKGPKTKTTTTTARGPQSTAQGNKGAKSTRAATTTAVPDAPTSANVPRNPRLADRLRTILDLPPGTDISPYAAGFRNQGQFVAAVHVSNNLGINFAELKTLMVDQNLSLGQAIQRLKPGVDVNVEADRAIRQSRQQ